MPPFQSESQRRYLWKFHPDVAKKWAKEYPESNKGLPMHKRKKAKGRKFAKDVAPDERGYY